MVDKGIVWLKAPKFECNRQKRKGDMEKKVWKYAVKSTPHGK